MYTFQLCYNAFWGALKFTHEVNNASCFFILLSNIYTLHQNNGNSKNAFSRKPWLPGLHADMVWVKAVIYLRESYEVAIENKLVNLFLIWQNFYILNLIFQIFQISLNKIKWIVKIFLISVRFKSTSSCIRGKLLTARPRGHYGREEKNTEVNLKTSSRHKI